MWIHLVALGLIAGASEVSVEQPGSGSGAGNGWKPTSRAIAPFALRGESKKQEKSLAVVTKTAAQAKAEKNDNQLKALADFGKQLAAMVSEGQAQANELSREIADYQDAQDEQILQLNEDDEMLVLALLMIA